MAAFTPTGVEFVAKGLGGYLRDLKKADKAQQNLGKSASGIGKSFAGLGQNILNVGAVASAAAVGGIAALGVGMAALGVGATSTAISFESAFTGVTKTVDDLVAEGGQLTDLGKELRQDFKNLAEEVPKTFEELAAIGEIGGQLGIGRESLLEFTETVSQLSDTTNLTAEDAASSLARISNIFQVTEEDVGDNVGRLGSALVDLGNNFAANESEILNFANRLAGAGQVAGFTQADILGISTAFTAVGVQAESGATAAQKVMLSLSKAVNINTDDTIDNTDAVKKQSDRLQTLKESLQVAELRQKEFGKKTKESTRLANQQKIDKYRRQIAETQKSIKDLTAEHGTLDEEATSKLKTFAETAGVTMEEFQKLFKEDASAAFELFVQGLGNAGEDAINILDELELKDQRLARAFLSLSNNSQLLTDALDRGSKGFEENTARAEEAEKRYATTESQFKIFRNVVRNVGDTIGVEFLPIVNKLLERGTELVKQFAEPLANFIKTQVVPAFNNLIDVFTRAVDQGGGLIEAFQFGGLSGLASRLGITQEITILRDQIVQTFRELGQTITEIWTSVFGGLASSDILTRINSAIIFIVRNFDAFKGALIGIGAVLAGGVFAAVLAGLVALITPINLIIVAAGLLGAAWATNWMGIQEITFSVIERIQNIIQVFVDAFQSNVLPPLQEAFGNLTEVLNDLGLTWGDVWDALGQATIIVGAVIGTALLAIISAVGGLVAAVAAGVAAATSAIERFQAAWSAILAGVSKTIIGFRELFVGIIQFDLQRAIDGLKLGMTGLGETIIGVIALISSNIVSAVEIWSSSFTAFKDTAIGIFTGLANALIGNSIIPDMIADITAALLTLPQIITDIFGGLAGSIGEAIGGLVGGIFGLGDEGEEGGIASLPLIVEQLGLGLLNIATVTMPLLQQAIMFFSEIFILQFTLINQLVVMNDLLLTNIYVVTVPAMIAIFQVFIQLVTIGLAQINELLIKKIELLGKSIEKSNELKDKGKEMTDTIKDGFDSVVEAINNAVTAMGELISQFQQAIELANSLSSAASGLSIGGGGGGGGGRNFSQSRGRPFQAGTDGVMTVPPGGLTARLHPGEEFAVAPRGQSLTNMFSGPMVQVNNPQINNGMDLRSFTDFINREIANQIGGVS